MDWSFLDESDVISINGNITRPPGDCNCTLSETKLQYPAYCEQVALNEEILFFDNVNGTGCDVPSSNLSSWDYWEQQLLNLEKSDMRRVMDNINLYLTPVIIVIGVFGNVLSFLVFSCTHLRRNSSSVYLASLALVDTGFLLCLLVVWLDKVRVPLFQFNGWCKAVVYLSHVCPFLSVWNVVGFTAERYVIVWHPLRKDRFCTPTKTKIIVGVLTVTGVALYCFTAWTSGIQEIKGRRVCMPIPKYFDVMTFLTSIDAVITLVLPSVIIIVLNIKIVIRIQYIQKRMAQNHRQVSIVLNHSKVLKKSTLRASISDKGSMHFRFSNRSMTDADVTFLPPHNLTETTSPRRTTVAFRGRSQYRLARMLLVVSSIFVLLNIPIHYFKIQGFVRQQLFGGRNYRGTKKELPWHEFFQMVYYLNFGINFFIYSVCGRPFRSGLKHLLLRMRHRLKTCCSSANLKTISDSKPVHIF